MPVFTCLAHVAGDIGCRVEGVGMISAQDCPAPGQRVLVNDQRRDVIADQTQGDRQIAGRG